MRYNQALDLRCDDPRQGKLKTHQADSLASIASSLDVVQQELAAHTAILAYVIAALRNSGLDTSDIAQGLMLLGMIEPVQSRVDAFAEALNFAGQFKTTKSALHLIDGGKDDDAPD